MSNNLKNVALTACNDHIDLFTELKQKLNGLEEEDDIDMAIFIEEYFKENSNKLRSFSEMAAYIRKYKIYECEE